MLLAMPYARLRQEIRLAANAEHRDRREALRGHALTSWHVIRANWGAKRPPPTFEQFLRGSGLHPDQDDTPTWTPPTPEERAAAERAERIALTYRGRLRKDP